MLSHVHSLTCSSTPLYSITTFHSIPRTHFPPPSNPSWNSLNLSVKTKNKVRCCCSENTSSGASLRTCKNCKTQYDPALNHPLACSFHPAHFGGETKRKFESVYAGGTMNTPDSGQVFEYWHCCGSEDPFGPGCTSSPHLSYDD